MTRPTQAADLTYFVEGMDCANCVQSVERMVARLPGTGAVQASFSRQTLQLQLDESQTPRQVLEKNLQALGYAPSLQGPSGAAGAGAHTNPNHSGHEHSGHRDSHAGHDHTAHDHSEHDHTGHDHSGSHAGHSHEHGTPGKPWYATGQGKLVTLTGVLLLLAWLFGQLEPSLGRYGYMAATLVGVWPLLRQALAAARLGNPFSINMLVTLAALGALLIGQAAEGAVVVFLFAVGELLEGVAAGRARQGLQSLSALAPRTALLLETVQGQEGWREVAANILQPGDVVQVLPGSRVPADGVIVAGHSSLDESPVTGESVPVSRGVGERAFAGSINGEAALRLQVDRAASDNTIARIIRMVEEAENSKAPTARFIDRFSRWYTPGVVLVAALVGVVPPLLGQPWHVWLYKGLALLLIGCPCALVLSVPAAITSAISAGTRQGLLIKGGAVLENMSGVKTVAFDKTGTLTLGRPQVTDIVALQGSQAEVLRLAAAVETGSAHPLARAILDEAQGRGLSLPTASQARAAAGQGVGAVVEGRTLQLSSPRYAAPLGAEQAKVVTALEETGKTVVVLQEMGPNAEAQVLGLLALRDELRPDAAAAVAQLRRLGVSAVMLSGDNVRSAQAMASALGIEAHAQLLPQDKLQLLGSLAGPVAFVGDGINDAPALARAEVSIAMGGGTDVALETAQVALLRQGVMGVPNLLRLSRAAMNNIKQNIAFALGLKLVFLVTTLLGYTSLWMAVLADTGATAIVTANALRLLRWKGQP